MNSPTAIVDIAEGEGRKLDAHALIAARRELFILRGRRALLVALLEHDTATANDVRAAVELPAVNPVCLGTVPGELARAGIIERVGFADADEFSGFASADEFFGFASAAKCGKCGRCETLAGRGEFV